MSTAVVSLGSNLGDRAGALQGAIDVLGDEPTVDLVGVSSIYETAPVGTDGPAFLNAVAVLTSRFSAEHLLSCRLAIEQCFERVRFRRWAPRTLDIDVITYDRQVCSGNSERELTFPHPRAHERAFVTPTVVRGESHRHPPRSRSGVGAARPT